MAKKKQEKLLTKEQAIAEAKRFLTNARETIAKSPIDPYGKIYEDSKYIREGAAMAYLAALKAIDGWLIGRGTSSDKLPKSIDDYWAVRKMIHHNGKFNADLTIVYQNLHIGAYYQGLVEISVIKSGLKVAKEIISILEK
jgi:hypothetical protein